MMNRLAIAALLSVCTITVIADNYSSRFVIETHSVRIPGGDHTIPVTFKLDSTSGNIWRFSGTNFVQIPVAKTLSAGIDQVTAADTAEQRRKSMLLKRMDEIIIPEIDFKQADIHAIIDFLQDASIKHDPEKRGINIILNIGGPPVQTNNDPFAESNTNSISWIPRITFSAINISLHEALNIITKVADLRYLIKGDVIIIVPYCAPIGEIVCRLYDLFPSTAKQIRNYRPELFETNQSPATAEDRWKQFFSDFGVTWPMGSSIKPVPLIDKVVVCNTHLNLEHFEQIMTTINTYPPRAGRFQLITAGGTSQSTLLLLDSDSGNTWKYNISDMDTDEKTIKSDSFLIIPESKNTPNQNNINSKLPKEKSKM